MSQRANEQNDLSLVSIKQDGHSPEKTFMLGILASSPFLLLSLPPLTTAVVLTTWSREMSAAAAGTAAPGGSISATVAPKTSHLLAVSSEHGNQSRRRKTEREREGVHGRARMVRTRVSWAPLPPPLPLNLFLLLLPGAGASLARRVTKQTTGMAGIAC